MLFQYDDAMIEVVSSNL